MSLQFILGNSGSGKTEYMFAQVVREAGKHPTKNYLIVVPEQFTMQTQKKLVELAPNRAIMNIDVLSFKRLAYRVFDDMGITDVKVLEETGKNLVLRKVAQEKEEQLTVLRPNMSRMGYIGEVKSLISELVQYNIGPEKLEAYIQERTKQESMPPAFAAKLSDIVTMYRGFEEFMQGSYITAEEILRVLVGLVDESGLLRDSVIVFDEFTGFTPIQNLLLRKLLPVAERIYVLLTIDEKENFYRCTGSHELFYLSKKTIMTLTRMAEDCRVELQEPVVLGNSREKRFQKAPELAFMEQNLFRFWYQRWHGPCEHISISTEKNPREELLWVARKITHLVRKDGYRYRDIAVVTGAVDTYGNYVQEIFGKYHIPYFLDQTTEILFHPFIECIRAILEIISSDFSYASVMRLLRSGFVPIEENDIDMLDNYLMATGIRGKSQWSRRFVRKTRKEGAYDLEKLEEIRSAFYELLQPIVCVYEKRQAQVSETITALYEVLLHMHAEEQLWKKEADYLACGQQAKSKEYGQIYQIVMELLEKYNHLLGDEQMDMDEFSEVLDAGLSAATVAAIPPGYDNVTIGDMERTRLDHVKVLFFVGVNDGIVPKSVNQGGIISEYEREMLQEADLELAPGAREKSFIQRFYLYRNLTKPSERLYISYARVDSEGKAARPSYLIGVLQKLFPDVEIQFQEDLLTQADFSTVRSCMDYLIYGQKDEAWYAVGNILLNNDLINKTQAAHQTGLSQTESDRTDGQFTDMVEKILAAPYTRYSPEPISRIVAEALYGHTLECSVTRLERFAACAYAHFLQYGLLLKEREVSQFENLDMGNLYHMALEIYSKKLEESEYDWFGVPEEWQKQYAQASMEEALAEYPNMSVYATAENYHMTERMQAIFQRTVWALTQQVRAGHFVPTSFEISFMGLDRLDSLRISLHHEQQMHLLGRIDRLDTCEEENRIYVKVIDYKSGNTKFDLIRIYQGLALQLVVYMEAGMELTKWQNPKKEVLPGGILYYHIDDPVLEAESDKTITQQEADEKILMELRPDGLVNRDETIYRSMDEDFEGKSKVIPVELKKSGELSEARSHVASSEEFEVIGTYVRNQIKEQGERIYEGDIAVRPYRDGQESSCRFCPYAFVCGIDGKIPGYQYRTLDTFSRAEVIERMQMENAKKE